MTQGLWETHKSLGELKLNCGRLGEGLISSA